MTYRHDTMIAFLVTPCICARCIFIIVIVAVAASAITTNAVLFLLAVFI